jgi:hypothetical protein
MRVRDIQRRRGTPGGQQRRGNSVHAAEQIVDLGRNAGVLGRGRRQGYSVQAHNRTVSQLFGDTGERRQAQDPE